MKRLFILTCFIFLVLASAARAATYYISPTGNNSANGTSQATAWATFNRAWQTLQPGDTLLMMDGTYRQQLSPDQRDGQPGKLISVKALNDGQAIIDGDTNGDGIGDLRLPVELNGSYYDLEGFIVKNGGRDCNDSNQLCYTVGGVVRIQGSHNILRRISAYNAHPDINSIVIGIVAGNDNLIEDCVAAGSGRKMAYIFGAGSTAGVRNIFRRVFAAWQEWKGAQFNPGNWPWGDTIETYNASNNIIENSISYGTAPGPGSGINVFGQAQTTASNNAVLGSMAIKAGMKFDGTQMTWPCPSPYQSGVTCTDLVGWRYRSGFRLGNADGSTVRNNRFQDIFAYGNGGLGFNVGISPGNQNLLIRATMLNNGLARPLNQDEQNESMTDDMFSFFSQIQDVYIQNTSRTTGAGARLTKEYESSFDGSGNVVVNLTNKPLWPWPMESRIAAEFGVHLSKYLTQNPGLASFSVTNTMFGIFNSLPSSINPLNDTSTPDTQAPSIPSGVSATAASSSQINISWSASTDNVAVIGYNVFRNGNQVATTAATSYSDTGLTAATQYSYKVAAFDGSGNISAQSSAASATTSGSSDTQAPSTPTGVSATVISATQINVAWSASTDNVAVTGYKVFRNGSQIATPTGTSYSNTGLTAATQYTYAVAAVDAAGNTSPQSSAVSATTSGLPDTTPPTVSLTAPANGATLSGNATVSATASDNVAVAGVTFKLDGASLAAEDTTSPYSISFNTANFSNGSHSLSATARDAAGNTGNSASITVTINNASQQGPLSISGVSDNKGTYAGSQVPQYSKLEITFQVDNSVATNVQLPYDPSPPAGISPSQYPLHKGISVDALFTNDNWQTTYRQPAFFYQPYNDQLKVSWDGQNHEWHYPSGSSVWKARFAPNKTGAWQYRIEAQDASGTAQSTTSSFQVVSSASHGFVRVSPTDRRYFEFDDGQVFYPQGLNINAGLSDPTIGNDPLYANLGQNGINFLRLWISNIYGSAWLEWLDGRNSYDGYLPRSGLEPFHNPATNKDTMAQVVMYNDPTGWYDPCRFEFWNDPESVKTGTNYRLKIKYYGMNIAGPRVSGKPQFGIVGKITTDWVPNCGEPGTGTVITTYGGNTSDWTVVEGNWNSGSNNFLPRIYIGLENVTQGKVYLDSVSLREDLGNGQFGPELITEPSMQYELYFPQEPSYSLDRLVETAEKYGIYLKLVVSEKNDTIYYKLDDDGTFVIGGEQDNPDGFYGRGRIMNRTRWLQQAWWRYLQARWGYSTSIHSWELTNEGDPFLQNHWEMTDELGKYMHCRAFGASVGSGDSSNCSLQHPNRHLVSTSFWTSFPGYSAQSGQGFWGNPKYPNVDYADVHAYISTSEAPLADRTLMQGDAAYYHLWHSSQFGSWTLGMPIVRGEAGMDLATQHATTIPGLQNDTQGIWYHNYVWSSVDSGALYEMYWWSDPDVYKPGVYDHRPSGLSLKNFLTGIPLSNGHYVDAGATASDTRLRVVGQKDLVNNKAHLWIQNNNHTWQNVVNNVAISGVTGTVRIPGLLPNRAYNVEWWDTYKIASQVSSTTTVSSAGDGSLTLPVQQLATDVAVKISLSGQGQTNQAPTVNAGPDLTGVAGSPVTLNGSVSDDGLPSSSLTITWAKVSGPGTVTFGNASAAATTATFSTAGTYVVRLTASDSLLSANDSASVVVSAASTNSPPVAANQSVTTPINTPVSITLQATDPNNDPLTYQVVSQPAHGTLSGSAPNLTFTPTAGYVGADSFGFRANDGAAQSNTAAVAITITNGGANACDLNSDGSVNVVDAQLGINQAVGASPCVTGDIDLSGTCTVVDVQRVINAALGMGCRTGA